MVLSLIVLPISYQISHDILSYDANKLQNDQKKLMMFFEDAYVLLHDKPMEKFKCLSNYDDIEYDDIENKH